MQGDMESRTGFLKLTRVSDWGTDQGLVWVRHSAITAIERVNYTGVDVFKISGISLPPITVAENPLELIAE